MSVHEHSSLVSADGDDSVLDGGMGGVVDGDKVVVVGGGVEGDGGGVVGEGEGGRGLLLLLARARARARPS